jgi:hypothetical protein
LRSASLTADRAMARIRSPGFQYPQVERKSDR